MSDVSLEEMMAIDSASAAPGDSELAEITVLAESQLFLESRVKELEGLLAAEQEKLRIIREVHLPEAMFVVGMKEFKLVNGYKITIKDDIFASIRKDFLLNAVKWLDTNGLGGIVKDDVVVKFGRDMMTEATQLVEMCKLKGWNADEKLSVHPQTLKATVKEQLAKGVEFPAEFFSIAPFKKAEIKK